jgi:hypothetical protein
MQCTFATYDPCWHIIAEKDNWLWRWRVEWFSENPGRDDAGDVGGPGLTRLALEETLLDLGVQPARARGLY